MSQYLPNQRLSGVGYQSGGSQKILEAHLIGSWLALPLGHLLCWFHSSVFRAALGQTFITSCLDYCRPPPHRCLSACGYCVFLLLIQGKAGFRNLSAPYFSFFHLGQRNYQLFSETSPVSSLLYPLGFHHKLKFFAAFAPTDCRYSTA